MRAATGNSWIRRARGTLSDPRVRAAAGKSWILPARGTFSYLKIRAATGTSWIRKLFLYKTSKNPLTFVVWGNSPIRACSVGVLADGVKGFGKLRSPILVATGCWVLGAGCCGWCGGPPNSVAPGCWVLGCFACFACFDCFACLGCIACFACFACVDFGCPGAGCWVLDAGCCFACFACFACNEKCNV